VRSVLAVALAIGLVAYPDKTRPMIINFMGMFWLASGIVSLRWGIRGGRPNRVPLAAGIIGVIAGIAILTRLFYLSELGSARDTVGAYALGLIMVGTGVLHLVHGFRGDQLAPWGTRILGALEVVLGIILLLVATSVLGKTPTVTGVAFFLAAGWAFIGAGVLMTQALRSRRLAETKEEAGED
jgi:uncharacterized membrane protein HdeD (DUF308 family)